MQPRIRPGAAGEISRVDFAIARAIGAATGGGPPNIFTTLARHRRLFRRWLRFAAVLMPGGKLPRADSELVILRVAHNCGSEYEWAQHERIALTTGLSTDDVERVREGPGAEGWSPRQQAFLRAVDELHANRDLSDEAWDALRPLLSDAQMIELCMLTGHYEMLAMTLNALRVQPDTLPAAPPSRALTALQRVLDRRRPAERSRA